MKAMNDEKNKNIKGDFKITEFIVFIVRMASEWLTSFFKDCITKNENAKYTPPINPKLIIATSSSHTSRDIILKSILKSTHHSTNKKPTNLELIHRNEGMIIQVIYFLLNIMIRIFPIVGLLLLIPMIAMQLTDEVNWSFFDFLIMGIMLSITGLALGIIIKKIKYHKYRNIFIAIIIMIFVLIWAELGVGLFGTPFAGS